MKWILYIIITVTMITATGCQNSTSNEKIMEKSTMEPTVVPTIEPIIDTTSDINPESTEIPASNTEVINETFTIVIDAGHQSKGNSKQEPIGPNATETKKKVSSGTQGIATKVPEYMVNLQVSLKLRDILEEQGYKVIMVRESNDVDISNVQRAKIANECKADALIRIHCNGSENKSVMGALTICPTKNNPYCSSIYEKSYKLSQSILTGLCDNTGAKKRNITETDTMTGINWSQVPVTIVEMGYLTNAREDKNLNDEVYQEKLANGIANGLAEYFR